MDDMVHKDETFASEQEHLSAVYAKLKELARDTVRALEESAAQAEADKQAMAEEISVNLDTFDDALETFADLNAVNTIVAAYNLSHDLNAQKLTNLSLLMRQPYFAKIVLGFQDGAEPKELYLGAAGMSDENYKRLIVDWRSPVAEVYYNQANGPTTYVADGRTIHTDLLLRRQFDIDKDQLIAYFDTTVAIQDPLLLKALAAGRTSEMKAITSTIQKEQNTVIRHADVPVLLVNGIAGSGKSSVMMQRIAYLLYHKRDALEPEHIVLITPNELFGQYISGVLPEMGEQNPQTYPFRQFLEQLLPPGRGVGDAKTSLESFQRIDEALAGFSFEPRDFKAIAAAGETLVSLKQINRLAQKYRHLSSSTHAVTLMREELVKKLSARLAQIATSEKTLDELEDMTPDEQTALFGAPLAALPSDEVTRLARSFIEQRFEECRKQIEEDGWIDIDALGRRLLKRNGLSSLEWTYLKMSITGLSDPSIAYVMIDEVQDRSLAELTIAAKYFRNAHFMLLGDPNQAIAENCVAFSDIKRLFANLIGGVSECRLTTSYRSSTQITHLFAALARTDDDFEIESVRPSKHDPVFIELDDANTYITELKARIHALASSDELAAIIVPWKQDAKHLAKALGEDAPILLDATDHLPEKGVVIIPLTLAKGLEFDTVIIADASRRVYPENDAARRRLYTAISRATEDLIVLSRGPLSEWLPR